MRDWFHSPLGLASPSVSLASSPEIYPLFHGRKRFLSQLFSDDCPLIMDPI
jgi:hypothetical protein